MYTRCTACHTVHPVNASLLSRGHGEYRCGKCNKSGNALDSLFDEWPAAGAHPEPAGDIPVLGMPIDLEEARLTRLEPDEAALSGKKEEPGDSRPGQKRGLRAVWVLAALFITVFVTVKLADFYEKPLLELALVQSMKSRLGLQETAVNQPFRDLSKIHLVSRELTSHPFQAETLRLTATIVNRAEMVQPYPDLEVILLDADGGQLTRLHFNPSQYLADGNNRESGMTPQAFLPFTLDLPDPGKEAVGFELDFQ